MTAARSNARTDWTEAVTAEVAPGVYRIPLPLPHDALRAVNVYALEDGDDLVLIDSGWALAAARSRLVGALAELQRDLGDVTRFLITHVHRDHYSQAIALRAEFGTRISLGVGERASVEATLDTGREPLAAQFARLRECGAGRLADDLRAAVADRPAEGHRGRPDDWLRGPVDIALHSRTLRAVPTPGHTQGHLVFVDPAAGLLFAGDHVLPHITPSIGFEPALGALPLGDYLDSLRLVRALPDTTLLPAHGPVSPSAHARIDELLAHHEARLDASAAALDQGASTAYEAARLLPWTRRLRALADLDPFNQMLAVIETAAHLDLLSAQGRIRSAVVDGVVHYAA
jgi:glyoxylase-like metal-dependent hydrolase (beta-lactamase superfamily II)